MNVLLLGDSIRMFYYDEVKKRLGANYECFSPDENCRFSAYVLNGLRHWLPQFPVPDIIHWNVGLWDIAILYKEDGCFIGKREYVQYMVKILRELKKTGAKIIFATTTPVHDNKQYCEGPYPTAARNEDIIAYNKAVLEAFKGEDIIINDLFNLMYPEREKYLCDDMLHPNEDGVNLLASAVVEKILCLGEVKNESVNSNSVVFVQREEKTIQ